MAQPGATWNHPPLDTAFSNTGPTPTPPITDWSSRLSNHQTGSRELLPSSDTRLIPTPASTTRGNRTSLGTHNRQILPGTRGSQRSMDTATPTSTQERRRLRMGTRRSVRQVTKPENDIPVFDRNKVSLDFPGSLFGPSVSLLIRSTKIIGDVIQNSAVRYQSFLRLFRPLFRGQFEIKGLDPPSTTTTTTAPASANEVVR